jgi:hypothetical protein
MTDEPEEAARRARTTTPRLLRGGRDGGDNGGMPPDLNARVKALEARTSWFVGVSVGLVALVFAVARALK